MEGTVDKAKGVQLTLSVDLDAAETRASMPAQFEVFQQLLSSDTDDYSVAHAITGGSKSKKRSKAEAKVDSDSDVPGTSSPALGYRFARVWYHEQGHEQTLISGGKEREPTVGCMLHCLPTAVHTPALWKVLPTKRVMQRCSVTKTTSS